MSQFPPHRPSSPSPNARESESIALQKQILEELKELRKLIEIVTVDGRAMAVVRVEAG